LTAGRVRLFLEIKGVRTNAIFLKGKGKNIGMVKEEEEGY